MEGKVSNVTEVLYFVFVCSCIVSWCLFLLFFSTTFFLLLFLFLCVGWIFYFTYQYIVDSDTQIALSNNFGFVLILITNPFIHFLYQVILESYLIFKDKQVKEGEKKWEFLYNLSVFHILNTHVYYVFQYLFKAETEMHVSAEIILFVSIFLSLTSVLSRLSALLYLYLGKDIPKGFKVGQFLSNQLVNIVCMSVPVYLFVLYFYSVQEYLGVIVSLFVYIFTSKILYQVGKTSKEKTELRVYKEMANKDPMTGCYNRRYLNEKLNDIRESRDNYAIVTTDIDNFKKVNDTYNHDIGDKVINHFVTTVKDSLKEEDVLVRSGGEEFLILLKQNDYSWKEIINKIENLRIKVSASPVLVDFKDEQVKITYTSSFGVSFYNGETNCIEELIIKSDNLLYVSKNSGKNRVSYEEISIG